MTWKLGREDIAAGPYQQRAGTVASSFTGINVGSQATVRDEIVSNASSVARFNAASLSTLQAVQASAHGSLTGVSVSSNFIGHSAIRGIATINSGTTVVSVAATGVVSGDIILTGIIQYTGDQTAPGTWGQIPVTCARSVRTGAFEIVTIASYAPVQNMPVGWFKIA